MAAIRWTVPPIVIASNIQAASELIHAGLNNRGQKWSAELESRAKRDRPWTDRTNNARNGLTGKYEISNKKKTSARLTIYLFHTVEYGKYLELGTERMTTPFAVLLPTMESAYNEIMSDMQMLFGG